MKSKDGSVRLAYQGLTLNVKQNQFSKVSFIEVQIRHSIFLSYCKDPAGRLDVDHPGQLLDPANVKHYGQLHHEEGVSPVEQDV